MKHFGWSPNNLDASETFNTFYSEYYKHYSYHVKLNGLFVVGKYTILLP